MSEKSSQERDRNPTSDSSYEQLSEQEQKNACVSQSHRQPTRMLVKSAQDKGRNPATDSEMNGFPGKEWLNSCADRFRNYVHDVLPSDTTSIGSAMRYATLSDGKCVRPALVYSVGEAFANTSTNKKGKEPDWLDKVAAAIELTHCYSLVHDDLPAMDNSEMRRGRPSCHVQYSEATAILAGDALQMLAVSVLSDGELPPELAGKMIKELADAGGYKGMIHGQMLDLFPPEDRNTDYINHMHALKTGRLFLAAVRMASLAFIQNPEWAQLDRHLQDYAIAFGEAFQIRDDILDTEEDSMSSPPRPNITQSIGVAASQELCEGARLRAHRALDEASLEAHALRWLVDSCATRED